MSNPKDSEDFDFDFEEESAEADPFADFPEESGEENAEAEENDPFEEEPAPAPTKASAPVRRNAPATTVRSQAPASGAAIDHRTASLASDLPVQVIAVIGKKTITVKELISLKKGQVIELNRFPNEAIDLIANGRLMAKGELVEVDGKLGVRIIKIFE